MRDVREVLELLRRLGAPAHLIRHHELVAEAAGELVEGVPERFAFDRTLVLLGAALHDAGKIEAPQEMHGRGSTHEPLGRVLIERAGHAELARFCETHATWDREGLALEDLLVALADKLWKGKRVADLEERVIRRLATESGDEFWTIFEWADRLFETVADAGPERLRRSSVG